MTSVDPEEDVTTFGGVLKRFDADGGGVDKSWTASDLLNGVQATLGDAHGYDIIILPVSKPGKNPHIKVSIDASSVDFKDDADEDVRDNVPFGWRVIMQ
ncbi:MAG TPA: hypothetical protein VHU41_13875 [Thermoanaerobaculia bacterium]|nr:hypothetical protein [Thermoanaerobaculia bacterium]